MMARAVVKNRDTVWTGAIRHGIGDCTGVTALEFALLAPVFMMLFFVLLETGIIFITQAMLQNAVNDAALLIRTGQVQNLGMSQSQFRDAMCQHATGLIACDNLLIDVQAFQNFSDAQYQSPLATNGTLNPDLSNFRPGNPGEVVLVRALYSWQVVTPLLTPFLANMADGKRLLVATTAFRNETF